MITYKVRRQILEEYNKTLMAVQFCHIILMFLKNLVVIRGQELSVADEIELLYNNYNSKIEAHCK